MIPRFKPYLGLEELLSLFRRDSNAVACFEESFARKLEAPQAIAFPYGRSALWAFFKSMGMENTEIIQPAYTCDVVAHATVLSGNIPRFVDIILRDYNMALDQVAEAINEKTRAIIATHLFGYPLDLDTLNEIVGAAQARYGHKIWIIQDCAHSFGARWQGELVCNAGDVSLFGLNISKSITSIFGGMLTIRDNVLANRIRSWRDAHFQSPSLAKSLRRRLYLFAVYPAFAKSLYRFVYWLQEATPFLNSLTKTYHLDEKIHFPPDYLDQMLGVEARVGLAQLHKYDDILRLRRENALFYDGQLKNIPGLDLPPLVDGATYSHYVIRVNDRQRIMKEMARRGIQIGQLIEYSVPHMDMYKEYSTMDKCPNSLLCSQHTINLPVYAGLRESDRQKVAKALIETMHAINEQE